MVTVIHDRKSQKYANSQSDCGSAQSTSPTFTSSAFRSMRRAKMRAGAWFGLCLTVGLPGGPANAQSVLPSDQWAPCVGSSRPGGPCNAGAHGGLNAGPGGGLYAGPGGGLYAGPGGGLYSGPGGGLYSGPGGGLYSGPGGGAYTGPGGGLYLGPGAADGYNGPWSPCFTGVFGAAWRLENCPGFEP
jgi:hypothetical protein